jgi:hypothetical protein
LTRENSGRGGLIFVFRLKRVLKRLRGKGGGFRFPFRKVLVKGRVEMKLCLNHMQNNINLQQLRV